MSERERMTPEDEMRALAQQRIERLTRTASALQGDFDALREDPEHELEAVADELDRLLREREEAAATAQRVVGRTETARSQTSVDPRLSDRSERGNERRGVSLRQVPASVRPTVVSAPTPASRAGVRSGAQMSGSQSNAPTPAQSGSRRLDDVLGALERLDEKVATLSRRQQDEVEDLSRDMTAFDAAGGRSPLREDPVAETPTREERPGRFAYRDADPEAHPESGGLSMSAYRELGRRIDALRKPQEETIRTVREGLGSLREAISGYAAGNRERSSRHAAELRHLADMVERLRAERIDDAPLRDMQKDVAELKAQLGRSNVDGALKTLEHGYAHILQRLDELNRGAIDPRVLRTITTRLDEIEDAFSTLPRADQMQVLESRLGDVSERVEDLIESHVPVDVEPLREELRELREVVARIDFTEVVESIDDRLRFVSSRLDELEHLARAQQGLDTRIAAMEERLPDADMMQRLHGRLEDIVGMLSDDRGPVEDPRLDEIAGRLERMERNTPDGERNEALSALEDKLEAIAVKIDVIEKRASRPVPVLDAGARKDGLTEESNRLLGDLQKRIAEMSDQLARPAETVTTSDLDLLRREISEMRAAIVAPQRTDVLEQRISELAETLSGSRGALDDDRLDQLGEKVARLASQLETSTSRDDETARIASALARIEENLKTSRDDVKGLARQAAREVAEELVANRASCAGQDVDGAIAGLQGDLRALLDAAQGSEERTRSTFEGVQSILSALTDRLEQLEKANRRDTSGLRAGSRMGALLRRDPQEDPAEDTAERPVERIRDRKADFIAAARRAAQAASEEAALLEQQSRRTAAAAPRVQPEEARPGRTTTPMSASVAPAAAGPATARKDVAAPAEAAPADAQEASSDDSRAGWFRNTLRRTRSAERSAEAAAAETAPARTPDAPAPSALRGEIRPAAGADSATEDDAEEGGKGRRRMLMFTAAAVVLALGTLQVVRMVTPNSPELAGSDLAGLETPGVDDLGQIPQVPMLGAPATDTATLAPAGKVTVQVAPEGLTQTPEAAESAVGTPPVAPETVMEAAPEAAQEADADVAAFPQSATPDTDLAFAAPVAPQVIGEAEPVPATGFSGATQDSAPASLTMPMPPAEVGSMALRTAAARGDAIAAFLVGVKYTEGQGVTADLGEAAKWYQQAAEQGLAPAQYRLASLYEKGRGVARDRGKARDWYVRAAEAGNAKSMHNLAVLYAEGIEGTPDFTEAAKWFEAAANHGIKDSLFNLGILYARGLGVEKDLVASYKWFAIAADQGDQDAARKRDEVANLLDQAGLAQARLAVESFKSVPLDAAANRVVPDPSWAEGPGFSTDASGLAGDTVSYASLVRDVQEQLNRLGYGVGTADGEMGPRTRSAIRAFQRKLGVSESGEVDADLLKALSRQDV